jgi:hypothetical protein
LKKSLAYQQLQWLLQLQALAVLVQRPVQAQPQQLLLVASLQQRLLVA